MVNTNVRAPVAPIATLYPLDGPLLPSGSYPPNSHTVPWQHENAFVVLSTLQINTATELKNVAEVTEMGELRPVGLVR